MSCAAITPDRSTNRSPNRFATATLPAPPEPRTVKFLLDGPNARPLLLQHILWMRLEGLSIAEIARAARKDTETVASIINLWQFQTERAGDDAFVPLAVCPRREAGRRRKKIPKANGFRTFFVRKIGGLCTTGTG